MEELRQISEMYPNYMNPAFPHSINCASQNGDLVKSFQRTLPKMFVLKEVRRFKEREGCVFVTRYVLKDGSLLPTGPALEELISALKKYTPTNAMIVNERVIRGEYVELALEVLCKCKCETLNNCGGAQAQEQTLESDELSEVFQIIEI